MRRIPISEGLKPRQLAAKPAFSYAPKPLKPTKPLIDQLGDLLKALSYGEMMQLDREMIDINNDVTAPSGFYAAMFNIWAETNQRQQVGRQMLLAEIADGANDYDGPEPPQLFNLE